MFQWKLSVSFTHEFIAPKMLFFPQNGKNVNFEKKDVTFVKEKAVALLLYIMSYPLEVTPHFKSK